MKQGFREVLASTLFIAAALTLACGPGQRTERPAAKSASPPEAALPVDSSDIATLTIHPPSPGRHPVIWIGLDGLDWELLDRLSSEGKIPNWTKLVGEGYSARLRSFVPLISPIVWTSEETGVAPDVHRVLDFQEVDPKTGAKVPISGRSRAVPAIWNIASAAGLKVGVVGFWATHPAEKVDGFFVSDHATPILFEKLPLAGVAYPTSLEPGVAQIVARDGRITAADLAPYLDVPREEIEAALSSGEGMKNPIVALARILGATRVTQRIARDLYDRNLPDLTAVYFEGTDEIGHIFASDSPPKLQCVSDADYARYHRAVEVYYATIDRILGQWMRRAADEQATLLVSSDHGFKWGADRPCGLESGNWATAAFWHRLDGVFAAWGARVRHRAERSEAHVLDVAPTILALLGLPADKKMPGHVVAEGFRDLAPAPKKDVFATMTVARVPSEEVSAEAAAEYSKKLLALGYLTPGEARPLAPVAGDRPGMTEGAWNNLGVYERDTAKNPAGARAAFERALALRPDYYSPMFNLAVLDRARGDARGAEDWLFRSLAALHTDPSVAIASWAHDYENAGKTRAAASLLARGVRTYPDNETIAREYGLLRYRAHDCRGAVESLARFETTTQDPRTLNTLALFETCLADRQAVIRILERSLALKPDQPEIARMLEEVREAGGG
jgi:predicted AlkP superfamily phosphohydrolase/phosphomutase/Flp pilus assembly protein TadD